MVTHMKTTIDIADTVLLEAKKLASQRGTTLRALVEAGLRCVLDAAGARERFTMRRVTFGGRGLRPEMLDGGWEALRDAAYRGRGA